MDQPILSQHGAGVDAAKIVLRRFPPPYRAMVAICSDIDQTRIDVFREIHRFMNTREETCIGRGLGLDIADSLWMYKAPHHNSFQDNLAYFADYGWTEPSPYADELMHYARAGWIDTMHTYGNFNIMPAHPSKFTREHAVRALDILERHAVALPVWVNHGGRNNRQNIGDVEWFEGDDPASSAYHLDLLRGYGTEYIWSHKDGHRPAALSVFSLMALRDGSQMFGFPRLTVVRDFAAAASVGKLRGFNYRGGTGGHLHVWLPQALAFQLSDEVLASLVEQQHLCVFAQHLGAIAPMTVFDREMAAALSRLRRWQDDGLILVARTSRLLHYNRVRDHLRFNVVPGGGCLVIDIEAVEDPVRGRWLPEVEDLRGVTFDAMARLGQPVVLALRGEPVAAAELATGQDAAGTRTIGIRWFAADETDHASPFLARERVSYVLWSAPARDRVAAEAAQIVGALRASGEIPFTLDQARRNATAAAIDRYDQGLAAATHALEQIGFTELRAGLDLGSGVGEWCLAFLQHSQRAVGIERRAEFVEVARIAAQWLGRADRARFIEHAIEELEPGQGPFDCAWCRSALTHLDVEAVLPRIYAALGDARHFYCSYAAEGQLLHDLGAALCGPDPAQAAAPLGDLLAGYERRCGLSHVPGSQRRLLQPDELLGACRTLGFTYIGQPGLQELQGVGATYLGISANFDLLVRKARDPDQTKAALLEGRAGQPSWLAELELLARSGCPKTVCAVLEAADPTFADPDARDLYARALIRAGRGGEAEAGRLSEAAPGLVPPLTAGLYRHDRGDYTEAMKCYARLTKDHPDRAFLIGACQLRQRDWTGARCTFRRAIERGSAGPPEWVGLIAAHLHRGDHAGAQRTYRDLATSRQS